MTVPTVPYPVSGVPIKTLRLDVLEGTDAGTSATTADAALTIGTAQGNSLVLTDPTVSRYHAELTREAAGIRVVDTGSTNGIVSGDVRIERGVVAPRARLRLGGTLLQVLDGDTATVELLEGYELCGLRGQTPIMRRLMAQIDRAAASEVTVLLIGESGTGKELIAEALHRRSPRADGPFVTVDCGALAPTLIASDLFGHERGAFTGAERRHIGAFEQASGGTLFLDELGELPEQLQVTLLGVLERGRFRRLGGQEEIHVDVRVVSATNRDLRAEVNASRFRLDLYYRLAVVTLNVPPLRDRPDDISMLVSHFLRESGHGGSVEEVFSPAAMATLLQHRWPGNVRELRNMVEATLAIGFAPAMARAVQGVDTSATDSSRIDLIESLLDATYKEARGALLTEFEGRYLRHLLERCQGNVSKAARTARMDRSHLSELLKRHSLR